MIIKEEPVYNWHIKYLCDELQGIAAKVKARQSADGDLIINISPGSTKSTIVSQMYPVWCWTIDPTIKLITSSNSKSLSTRDAMKSRDVIRSDKFRSLFPELQIKDDADNKINYENTNTGKRMASSVGGTIVGEHAHIIIADDPLNPKSEPSELQLQTANDYVDYLRTTRKINSKVSVFILVMQRLNENDPSGHLLANKENKIRHICLPACLDDNDNVKPAELKANYIDGLFDAVRLDRLDLADKKSGLGSYGYAGQYGQTPAPSGGGIFKKSWFQTFELDELQRRARDKGVQLVWNTTVDGAYTSDTNNAQSAIFIYTIFENSMYVREVVGVWEELPDFVKTLYSVTQRNGYTSSSSIYVEPKATGLPIVQTLKRETILNMVIDKAPSVDKVSRARSCAPFCESKRVYLLNNAGWVNDFIHQCTTFPNGKLKDKVDCMVMAIQRVNENRGGFLEVGFS